MNGTKMNSVLFLALLVFAQGGIAFYLYEGGKKITELAEVQEKPAINCRVEAAAIDTALVNKRVIVSDYLTESQYTQESRVPGGPSKVVVILAAPNAGPRDPRILCLVHDVTSDADLSNRLRQDLAGILTDSSRLPFEFRKTLRERFSDAELNSQRLLNPINPYYSELLGNTCHAVGYGLFGAAGMTFFVGFMRFGGNIIAPLGRFRDSCTEFADRAKAICRRLSGWLLALFMATFACEEGFYYFGMISTELCNISFLLMCPLLSLFSGLFFISFPNPNPNSTSPAFKGYRAAATEDLSLADMDCLEKASQVLSSYGFSECFTMKQHARLLSRYYNARYFLSPDQRTFVSVSSYGYSFDSIDETGRLFATTSIDATRLPEFERMLVLGDQQTDLAKAWECHSRFVDPRRQAVELAVVNNPHGLMEYGKLVAEHMFSNLSKGTPQKPLPEASQMFETDHNGRLAFCWSSPECATVA